MKTKTECDEPWYRSRSDRTIPETTGKVHCDNDLIVCVLTI